MTNQEFLERIRDLDRLYAIAERRDTPATWTRYESARAELDAEIDADERRQTA